MTSYFSIDPGASGAICIFDQSTGNVSSYNMPETREDITSIIKHHASYTPIAYLEKVGGFINVGGKQVGTGPAMFNFGMNYGILVGALLASGVKVIDVLPQEWQKGLHVGSKGFGDKKARKLSYRNIAAKKFPEIKVTAKNADALCIGLWAMPAVKHTKPEIQGFAPTLIIVDELVGEPSDYAQLATVVMANRLSKAKPTYKPMGNPIDLYPHKTRIEKLTVKEQYAEAVAWCKKNGWKVPPKGPRRTEMFDDWYNRAINGEA